MADKLENTLHLEYGIEEKQIGVRSADAKASEEGSQTADVDRGPDQNTLEDVFDAKEAKLIVRKIDYRIVPLLSLLYL